MKSYTVLITNILITTTLLSGTILASTLVSADNDFVVDEINIIVPVSCTLSGFGMTSHNANITNGTYDSNIGETTMKAFCNDSEGFAIYAVGYTDNEDGENVLTDSTLGSTYDIATGTATSGDTSNWAMKLSTITSPTPTYPIIIAGSSDDTEKVQDDPDYSTFQEVPDDYTKVVYRTSATDAGTNVEGATLTTTYRAYISKTQPAGIYTGQVKYTLVHPHDGSKPIIPGPVECEPGKICYNANANGVVGTMGKQDLFRDRDWSQCAHGTDYYSWCGGATDYIDINTLPEIDQYRNSLYASNFSREGYGFAGWNDKYDMSGTNYGPNQDVVIPLNEATNGFSLYAHWVESSGELQNWTGCSLLAANQVIGLTDTRDGNVYAVAKLADGNCWMVENLRLDDSVVSLNSANTNNPASGFTSLAASNSNWCTSFDEACINQNYLNTNNTTLFAANTSSFQDGNIYSYGNYYNWYSATAGNGTYSLGDSDASGDICPAGWHLPSGNMNDQFANLNNAIHSVDANATLRDYPANYVYSGFLIDSNVSHRGFNLGGEGDYMTRTPAGNNLIYRLRVYNVSTMIDTYYLSKFYGYSIRCLSN